MLTGWHRVSKQEHCPICGKPDWCLMKDDGTQAICQRITEGSIRQMGEAGRLHQLSETLRQYPRKSKPHAAPVANVEAVYGLWEGRCLPALAKLKGVSIASLEWIRAGHDERAWTYPMFDDRRRMIGVRREFPDGGRFSLQGTHNGLFMGRNIQDGKIYLPEGPTDLCALFDLGLQGIARPSNSGGGEFLKRWLWRDLRRRDVVIVSDNDKWKTRPSGGRWKPGQEGAANMAEKLLPVSRSVTIIKPPKHKDLREAVNDGCTRQNVEAWERESETVYRR